MYDPESLEEPEDKSPGGPSQKRGHAKHHKRHEQDQDRFDHWPEGEVGESAPQLTQFPHGSPMLQFLFELLVPPLYASPEMLRRHRLILSLTVLALSTLMLGAFGMIPKFPSFAYASGVTDIKVELLEQRIFDNNLRWCDAATTEARRFYSQKVSELQVRYRQMTGADFPIPRCEQIK